MWEAIQYLELTCALKRQICAFIRCMSLEQRTWVLIVHKAVNVYAPDRFLYFVSDAPRLLKTFRNNILSWRSHGDKRLLKVNDQFITWDHIRKLWENDVDSCLYKTKLTYDHIYLAGMSKMKVKLAAQVIGQSVGNILQAYGDGSVQETANAILLFDAFFICMNVRSHAEGVKKRKPFCLPYTLTNDPRFKWLNDVFLPYFICWRDQEKATPKRNKMFVSQQTFQGIVMTVRPVSEVTKYLLEHNVKYVLINKFCQDPIEKLFGRHRAIGRRADNMNLSMFSKQERSLHVQGNLQRQLKPHGNITGKREKIPVEINSTQLPKVQRRKK